MVHSEEEKDRWPQGRGLMSQRLTKATVLWERSQWLWDEYEESTRTSTRTSTRNDGRVGRLVSVRMGRRMEGAMCPLYEDTVFGCGSKFSPEWDCAIRKGNLRDVRMSPLREGGLRVEAHILQSYFVLAGGTGEPQRPRGTRVSPRRRYFRDSRTEYPGTFHTL